MSGAKRKRTVLPLEKKVVSVNHLENGESVTKLAKEYGLGQSTLLDLNKTLKYISETETGAGLSACKILRQPVEAKLEEALYNWFLQKRAKGEPVSGPILSAKASQSHQAIGCKSSQSEKSAPDYKTSEECITVLACANMSGTHKLKLACIGKAQNPLALKNVCSNLPVVYLNQKNAWMDGHLFHEWFTKHFVPSVQREQSAPPQVLLLVDNAPHVYQTTLLSDDGRIKSIFLPPNITSLVQPVVQGVLETMKRHYRKNLLRRLLLEEGVGGNAQKLSEFWKSLNIKDALYSVANAWHSITKHTILKSWRKLWPE
uniref:HTH psq-type domain-containing protein n=1 Tax=Latimeria chalumnae TaxID=7897 RepID=H3BCC2_LATCH